MSIKLVDNCLSNNGEMNYGISHQNGRICRKPQNKSHTPDSCDSCKKKQDCYNLLRNGTEPKCSVYRSFFSTSILPVEKPLREVLEQQIFHETALEEREKDGERLEPVIPWHTNLEYNVISHIYHINERQKGIWKTLNKKESEITKIIIENDNKKTLAEIGYKLGISRKTVSKYKKSIIKKSLFLIKLSDCMKNMANCEVEDYHLITIGKKKQYYKKIMIFDPQLCEDVPAWERIPKNRLNKDIKNQAVEDMHVPEKIMSNDESNTRLHNLIVKNSIKYNISYSNAYKELTKDAICCQYCHQLIPVREDIKGKKIVTKRRKFCSRACKQADYRNN